MSLATKLITYADLLSKSNGACKNRRAWNSDGEIWEIYELVNERVHLE